MKNNWNQITIGEYQRILLISEMRSSGQLDDLDFTIELVSLLSGKEVKEVEEMPYIEIVEASGQLAFLNEPIPKGEVKRYYPMRGKKFEATGTAKKISEASAREMKAIQYIDALTFSNSMEPAERIDNIHTELALFLIPENESYGTDNFSISENAEIIKNNMLITDALAVSAFFLLQYEALTRAIVVSLERRAKRAKKEERIRIQDRITQIKEGCQNLLQRNGAGVTTLA